MFGLFLNTAEMRLRRLRQRIRAFVDLAGDAFEDGMCRGKWAMITLTYRDVDGWSPDDIREFLNVCRQYVHRAGAAFVYVWVAELQARGAVHYHVLVKMPKGISLPKPDKVHFSKVGREIAAWWSKGSSRVEWIRLSGKRYLSKYTSKGSDGRGHFPKGARIVGAGGLPAEGRAWWSWLLSPSYVRSETEPKDMVKRVRGGWKSALGFLPTPWSATPMPDLGGVWLQRKTVEHWCDSGIEPHLAERVSCLQSVRDTVQGYVETMWQCEGSHWKNPWTAIGTSGSIWA